MEILTKQFIESELQKQDGIRIGCVVFGKEWSDEKYFVSRTNVECICNLLKEEGYKTFKKFLIDFMRFSEIEFDF